MLETLLDCAEAVTRFVVATAIIGLLLLGIDSFSYWVHHKDDPTVVITRNFKTWLGDCDKVGGIKSIEIKNDAVHMTCADGSSHFFSNLEFK